ncbi:MAG: hypothetical protein A3B10_01825 [Candidatus Doudnabacteria bacterium RIFCSPLOWO2_01_FULL_44_21]|uniref:Glutamyl-tRNA amidotransferase n=1 Tax=Candidatus Doudnabacteria bacterium RIFCSPLOWO2_01_FULL_44_21 TaxID=1817841 RepID=A0A1F5Q2K2_9BACT|nr:MAG: hypothetical protein A3B95_01710 [Candidatus Doudnabacteria bacterium RIFCSPHIGHO2_02_FULL_43_13b]OGE96403.1 MAG: hypothetical protein A3B10_01825 [Candidatus Doudnabacteria bacterium RIFCSPLOWO2_01_FULL_44_21]
MLQKQIDEDLKNAQKEKNEVKVSSLRNLKAAIKNAEIAKKGELTEADLIKVVAKKVKQHKDSIESFKQGNRTDLVDLEEQQMQVLQAYLPKAMSEEEVALIVASTISKLAATPADFGKVMKEVINQTGGGVDGSVVSRLVKEQLK